MRKLLLICSAIALIYGNCVWGMDSDDEMDWEPTIEQEWLVKADKSMTRLERQKQNLQRLHEQFEQNNQSNKPELQELRRNSLVQERRKIFEQRDPQLERISGSENKKMTIAEYQQALEALQEKLDESIQRENAQKAKIRELSKLLENVKQRLQQAKDGSPKQKSSQNEEEGKQSEANIPEIQQHLELAEGGIEKLESQIKKMNKDELETAQPSINSVFQFNAKNNLDYNVVGRKTTQVRRNFDKVGRNTKLLLEKLKLEQKIAELEQQLSKMTQKFEKEQELRKQAEEEIRKLKQQPVNQSAANSDFNFESKSTTSAQINASQKSVSNTSQNQTANKKSAIVTMSVNGKKMPVLRRTDFETNSEASFENDIDGRLFVIGDQTSGQNEIQSIIDSLDSHLLDQDPIQKEREIRDDVIKNRKGLLINDKDSWNAIAKIIGKRIFIYHLFQGFVHGFYEYGKEFSSNGTRRICLNGYPTSMKYQSFHEAVSIDGKIIPIMFCSSNFLNTLQEDIKGRLFKREDKGAGWKAYLNQCAMNSLELYPFSYEKQVHKAS